MKVVVVEFFVNRGSIYVHGTTRVRVHTIKMIGIHYFH